MKTTKDKKYSFNHTKDRLKERFDLLLTWSDYETLCNICTSDALYVNTLIVQESNNQEIHEIFFKGRNIRFTFNTKKGWITTALLEKKKINDKHEV